MFFILLFITLGCSGYLGYVYSNSMYPEKKNLLTLLWAAIIVCTLLICSNRASLGLVFNSHMPEADFLQTIDGTYLLELITNIIIGSLIFALYLFLNRKLKISSYWFLAFLLMASIIIYYPGVPSADGDGSYNQYLTHTYTNWQPPLFTIWWNLFQFHGATFLVNMFTYYGGLIYISYYLAQNNKRWQNDLLIIFSLNPLLFTQLVIIWKDIGFTAFLIDCVAISLALMITTNKAIRSVLWVVYFSCLFLAIGFRINGLIAVFPFLFFAMLHFLSRFNSYKKYALSTIASLAITIAYLGINNFLIYKVFKATNEYASQFVMLADSAYIECATYEEFKLDNRFLANHDDALRDTICEQALNYYNSDALFNDWNNWGIPYKAPLVINPDPEAQSLAKTQWLHAITHYPGAYLAYRGKFLTNVFFFQYWYPSGTATELQSRLNAISNYQHQNMKFIMPLFMLAVTLAIIVYCWRLKRFALAWVIILSSILQLIGWFFLIPAHAARYFLWDYMAAVLGLILLNIDQIKVKNNENTKQP